MAEDGERQRDNAGGDAGTARGDHGPGHSYAGGSEDRLQLGGGLERAIGVEKGAEGDVARAWNVARAQAGAGLRRGACKASGGSRIDDLCCLACDQCLHVACVAHELCIEHGGEMTLAAPPRLPILERMALCLPFSEAAIENVYIRMPHDAEHPPNARRRVKALAVVCDDLHAI